MEKVPSFLSLYKILFILYNREVGDIVKVAKKALDATAKITY